MRGQGCPGCANNIKSTTKEFIDKSIKIHGDKYDYSKVSYETKNIKVRIICSKHGEFEQLPRVHLRGHGCTICNNSKLELYMKNKLDDLKIDYVQNKRFDDCRNVLPLPFDFYLEDLNILIECDGVQHFESIEFFGGDDRLSYQKKNDEIKNKFCEDNNIILYRVRTFSEIDETILHFS